MFAVSCGSRLSAMLTNHLSLVSPARASCLLVCLRPLILFTRRFRDAARECPEVGIIQHEPEGTQRESDVMQVALL